MYLVKIDHNMAAKISHDCDKCLEMRPDVDK